VRPQSLQRSMPELPSALSPLAFALATELLGLRLLAAARGLFIPVRVLCS
jgi:hypothetical protein